MKYLQLITITLFISACSSKKHIIEAPKQEVIKEENVKVAKIEDPIIEQPKPFETVSEVVKILEDTIGKISEPKIQKKTKTPFNHNSWNILLQKYVSNQGRVNYKGFNNDKKSLINYITLLSENIPYDSWTKNEKLAYWINAYNALTIDLILRNYPVESIKDIKNPWEQRLWKLGNKWYNLEDIEHQILRKMNEPRIHFAIVCASFSCPKLQNEAFTAKDLERQLTNATKDFLNDSNRNEISENNIKLSKVFQWFSKDFKQNESLIEFLNLYSAVTISEKAKKSFKDYNWDLND